MSKKSIEEEIELFLETWGCQEMVSFLKDIIPLFDLYDVDEEDDWVRDNVGEDNLKNVRLIRTVYLMSKIAETHAGKLAILKVNFKDLYKRIEKNGSFKDQA